MTNPKRPREFSQILPRQNFLLVEFRNNSSAASHTVLEQFVNIFRFLKFYATFPLCTEVIMQSNLHFYIFFYNYIKLFIVTLECLLLNENKIHVNKTILFKYNLKQNAYER